MKYVKKPIVVEAFQFGVDEQPEWFTEKIESDHNIEGYSIFYLTLPNWICTVATGDFIIQVDTTGEIYPCKKDIFDATYDLVEEERPDRYPDREQK